MSVIVAAFEVLYKARVEARRTNVSFSSLFSLIKCGLASLNIANKSEYYIFLKMLYKDAELKIEARKNEPDDILLGEDVKLKNIMPVGTISTDYGWNLGIKNK